MLVGMAVAFVNIFPGLLIGLALVFELNLSTTIISVAAVEAALAALRARQALPQQLADDYEELGGGRCAVM